MLFAPALATYYLALSPRPPECLWDFALYYIPYENDSYIENTMKESPRMDNKQRRHSTRGGVNNGITTSVPPRTCLSENVEEITRDFPPPESSSSHRARALRAYQEFVLSHTRACCLLLTDAREYPQEADIIPPTQRQPPYTYHPTRRGPGAENAPSYTTDFVILTILLILVIKDHDIFVVTDYHNRIATLQAENYLLKTDREATWLSFAGKQYEEKLDAVIDKLNKYENEPDIHQWKKQVDTLNANITGLHIKLSESDFSHQLQLHDLREQLKHQNEPVKAELRNQVETLKATNAGLKMEIDELRSGQTPDSDHVRGIRELLAGYLTHLVPESKVLLSSPQLKDLEYITAGIIYLGSTLQTLRPSADTLTSSPLIASSAAAASLSVASPGPVTTSPSELWEATCGNQTIGSSGVSAVHAVEGSSLSDPPSTETRSTRGSRRALSLGRSTSADGAVHARAKTVRVISGNAKTCKKSSMKLTMTTNQLIQRRKQNPLILIPRTIDTSVMGIPYKTETSVLVEDGDSLEWLVIFSPKDHQVPCCYPTRWSVDQSLSPASVRAIPTARCSKFSQELGLRFDLRRQLIVWLIGCFSGAPVRKVPSSEVSIAFDLREAVGVWADRMYHFFREHTSIKSTFNQNQKPKPGLNSISDLNLDWKTQKILSHSAQGRSLQWQGKHATGRFRLYKALKYKEFLTAKARPERRIGEDSLRLSSNFATGDIGKLSKLGLSVPGFASPILSCDAPQLNIWEIPLPTTEESSSPRMDDVQSGPCSDSKFSFTYDFSDAKTPLKPYSAKKWPMAFDFASSNINMKHTNLYPAVARSQPPTPTPVKFASNLPRFSPLTPNPFFAHNFDLPAALRKANPTRKKLLASNFEKGSFPTTAAASNARTNSESATPFNFGKPGNQKSKFEFNTTTRIKAPEFRLTASPSVIARVRALLHTTKDGNGRSRVFDTDVEAKKLAADMSEYNSEQIKMVIDEA